MEYITNRITIDPELCNGQLAVSGKRITVQTVLAFLSAGDSKEEILEAYPSSEPEDIDACLKGASQVMENHYDIRPTA